MKPWITVYTCNVNNYDFVLPPLTADPNLVFVCFTDRPNKRIKGWDVRPLQSPPDITNPTLINRYHKFFPHKLGFETDWSIYVDGNMRVLGPVSDLVREVQSAGAVMACLQHPWRSTVEEEIVACERGGKISSMDVDIAQRRLQLYVTEGMPIDATLLENKVIIRNHGNNETEAAMDTWWDEFQVSVKRDQLSLPYVLWKHRLQFKIIPVSTWENREYFQRYGHRKRGLVHIRQLLVVRRLEPGFQQIAGTARLIRRIIMLVRKISANIKKTILREYPPLGCRHIKKNRCDEEDKTGGSTSAAYCYSVWLRHLTYLAKTLPDFSFGTIAEIGPGDSIGVGIAALLTGCSTYYGLDAQQYASRSRDIKVFKDLIQLYVQQNDVPHGEGFEKIKPFLDSYAFPIEILSDQIMSEQLSRDRMEAIEKALHGEPTTDIGVYYRSEYNRDSLMENSCDLIVSQAVLEHVMNIDELYNWMANWLKKGGVISHQIDFKSHGTALDWNGHWTYNENQWVIARNPKTFRNLNRWPFSAHVWAIEAAGFEILFTKRVETPSSIKRRHLARRWQQSVTDEDLKTSGAYIIARKK